MVSLTAQLVVMVCAAYLAFLFLWGLNYLRLPLSSKIDYEANRVDIGSVRALKRLSAERLNEEYGQAQGEDWPSEGMWRTQLGDSFREVASQLGGGSSFTLGLPKRSVLNYYLGAAGVTGFVNPFCAEVVLDAELLPIETPFTLAHEWAHLAGFADESEASFVAFLACVKANSAIVRYSGWFAMYQHTPWPSADGATLSEEALPRLREEVLADLRAVGERLEQRRSRLISRVQSSVYDRYLKANGVSAGVASYGLLVNLVVGTRFESGWVPGRR
jgi:hypothetical protein